MQAFKRYLGYLWVALAIFLFVFMVLQAYRKVSEATPAAHANTLLQWVIILIIFLPICIGLAIFGVYALRGEYDRLAHRSSDL